MSKQSITKRTVEMPPTSVERFMVNLSGDGVRRLLADKKSRAEDATDAVVKERPAAKDE